MSPRASGERRQSSARERNMVPKGRRRMTEPDDDPQLRALRAVWLAMPDEEPPERGLGELMAAARTRADEMKTSRAAWWRRVFDLVRRPPVLALATVTVLAGGAVLVAQRHADMEATPVLDRGPTFGRDVAPAPGVGGAANPAGQPVTATPAAATHEAPEASELAPTGSIGSTPASEPPAPKSKPAKPGQPPPARGNAEIKSRGRGAAIGGAKGGAGDSVTDKRAGAVPKDPAAQKPAAIAAPSADDEAQAPAATKKKVSKSPPVSQLLEQCRSAAARGDCAAMRALAQRIANQDAKFYRDQVASDASLGKCLAAE